MIFLKPIVNLSSSKSLAIVNDFYEEFKKGSQDQITEEKNRDPIIFGGEIFIDLNDIRSKFTDAIKINKKRLMVLFTIFYTEYHPPCKIVRSALFSKNSKTDLSFWEKLCIIFSEELKKNIKEYLEKIKNGDVPKECSSIYTYLFIKEKEDKRNKLEVINERIEKLSKMMFENITFNACNANMEASVCVTTSKLAGSMGVTMVPALTFFLIDQFSVENTAIGVLYKPKGFSTKKTDKNEVREKTKKEIEEEIKEMVERIAVMVTDYYMKIYLPEIASEEIHKLNII